MENTGSNKNKTDKFNGLYQHVAVKKHNKRNLSKRISKKTYNSSTQNIEYFSYKRFFAEVVHQ